MSEKPDAPATERVTLELEGVATAPILVFDEASLYGVMPGMGRVTLAAYIQDEDGLGGVKARRVVVAHLRGGLAAFESLRGAIDGMEMLITPPAGEKPN